MAKVKDKPKLPNEPLNEDKPIGVACPICAGSRKGHGKLYATTVFGNLYRCNQCGHTWVEETG